MRSGNIALDNGYLRYTNHEGRYWSRAAQTIVSLAYYLYIGPTDVHPSRGTNRYIGLSLRCLQE